MRMGEDGVMIGLEAKSKVCGLWTSLERVEVGGVEGGCCEASGLG